MYYFVLFSFFFSMKENIQIITVVIDLIKAFHKLTVVPIRMQ